MTELDQEELELLRAARRQFTPAPEVARRVAAALAGGLAPPAITSQLASGVQEPARLLSGSQSTLLGQWLAGATAKTVLGVSLALLGIAGGTAAVLLHEPPSRQGGLARGNVSPQAPLAAAAAAVAPTRELATAPNAETSHAGATLERSVAAPVPAGTTPERIGPREGNSRSSQNTKALRAPAATSLGEELAAVRAVESALDEGDPSRALSILDATRPPADGALGEERTALRLLARCAAGGDQRPNLVAHFLAQYPRSVYAARLRAACSK